MVEQCSIDVASNIYLLQARLGSRISCLFISGIYIKIETVFCVVKLVLYILGLFCLRLLSSRDSRAPWLDK